MTDRALLEDLRNVVKEGFRHTNANLEIVASDLSVVKSRVDILETERTKLSGGVRGLSTSNAEQDAQLAQERMAREALAKKVDELGESQTAQTVMLSKITGILDTPMAKRIGQAAGGLVLAALIAASAWLARGNVPAPPPTVIQMPVPVQQLAPVTIYADAGAR